MTQCSNYMKNCYKNKQRARFRNLNTDATKESPRLLRKICSGFSYIGARREILTLLEFLSLYLWSPELCGYITYLGGFVQDIEILSHQNHFDIKIGF